MLMQFLGTCCLHLTINRELSHGLPSGDFISLSCDPRGSLAAAQLTQGQRHSAKRLLKCKYHERKRKRLWLIWFLATSLAPSLTEPSSPCSSLWPPNSQTTKRPPVTITSVYLKCSFPFLPPFSSQLLLFQISTQ